VLSHDLDAMAAALKVGPTLREELERNRALASSPTMPALDRFTGVLFEALGADTLDADARAYAGEHIAIHSALFGLVGALDPVPAYRLSHDSRLPGLSLKKTWAKPVAELLAARDGLILDLRSEAYAALGPAPQREGSYFVRVVADDGDGRTRALNHFNKKGKGEFVRTVLETRPRPRTVDELFAWAAEHGIRLSHGARGELELVVRNSLL